MKIKQQKQIEKYLTDELGIEEGKNIFAKQSAILDDLVKNQKDKSKNQIKTLTQTILPRIALYKSFKEYGYSEDKTYEYMKKYMLDIVAAKKHLSTKRMELVPGFYAIYKNIFLKIMRTTDLQISTQKHGKNYFDVTITKCLWHTACVENECEKLCCLFCDVDNVTYGGLKKIGFTRTKTLGYDGDCCDFHFYKK